MIWENEGDLITSWPGGQSGGAARWPGGQVARWPGGQSGGAARWPGGQVARAGALPGGQVARWPEQGRCQVARWPEQGRCQVASSLSIVSFVRGGAACGLKGLTKYVEIDFDETIVQGCLFLMSGSET